MSAPFLRKKPVPVPVICVASAVRAGPTSMSYVRLDDVFALKPEPVPTVTAVNGKIDIITLIYDGSNFYAAALQNF